MQFDIRQIPTLLPTNSGEKLGDRATMFLSNDKCFCIDSLPFVAWWLDLSDTPKMVYWGSDQTTKAPKMVHWGSYQTTKTQEEDIHWLSFRCAFMAGPACFNHAR